MKNEHRIRVICLTCKSVLKNGKYDNYGFSRWSTCEKYGLKKCEHVL